MTAARKSRARELGVTDDDYRRMLHEQDGHCALCPTEPRTRRLHVDHDHATGRVRGLLCYRCNRSLPAYVTADWLEAAAAYVADEDRLVRAARTLRLQRGEAYPSPMAVERELVRGVPELKP